MSYVSTLQVIPVKSRTVAQLVSLVHEQAKRAREEEHRQKEQQKRLRLEKLAEQEPNLWAQVLTSIQQRNTKGYDQAVNLLRDLRELAQSRGEQASFQKRVEQLQQQFATLSAFKSRLIAARLIKG
jgi:prephenate dehydrogenase